MKKIPTIQECIKICRTTNNITYLRNHSRYKGSYEANKTYEEHDIVEYNKCFYKATGSTKLVPFNKEWKLIYLDKETAKTIKKFVENREYKIGEIISFQGDFYQTNEVTKNIPITKNWELVKRKQKSFGMARRQIDGYEVITFDYWYPEYSEFTTHNAFELRGLVFIKYPNGTYKHYLSMPKFFNDGETKGWLMEEINHKKIKRIVKKEDGSLILFIQLPNGKIYPRTKGDFFNFQSLEATHLLKENNQLSDFVKECLENDIMPEFEYVATPLKQKHVLTYDVTKLVLLQMRNNITGEFLDIANHPLVLKYNIEIVEEVGDKYGSAIEQIRSLFETIEGIEGVVVTLEDGQLVKIKTQWYFKLHRLKEKTTRENDLINLILNKQIDDAIALIAENDIESKNFIENIKNQTFLKIAKMKSEITDIMQIMHFVFGIEKETLEKTYRERQRLFCTDERVKNHKYSPLIITLFKNIYYDKKLSLINTIKTKMSDIGSIVKLNGDKVFAIKNNKELNKVNTSLEDVCAKSKYIKKLIINTDSIGDIQIHTNTLLKKNKFLKKLLDKVMVISNYKTVPVLDYRNVLDKLIEIYVLENTDKLEKAKTWLREE